MILHLILHNSIIILYCTIASPSILVLFARIDLLIIITLYPILLLLPTLMSLPYHRGHSSNNNNMHRPNWNSNNNNTSPYPNKERDRANEVSTTLMEMENNQRWVCLLNCIANVVCLYEIGLLFKNKCFVFRPN